jgi:2-haloacid dehalogenase
VLDFTHFEWVSFDCYGTLIDWESGILGYLQPLLRSKNRDLPYAEILRMYSEFEPAQQSKTYRPYREILAGVVRDFARELRFDVSEHEAAGLADSIRDWQPFSDTMPALQILKSRYKLAILSNIDDDLFAYSAAKLEVPFDCVVTAQQARSYKPALGNFHLLLQRLQIPRSRLLHVAESLFHDVAPANSLGIKAVWVNRRRGRPAAASKLVDANPDLQVSDLGELASLLQPGR